MSENIKVNGVTYPEVDSLNLLNEAGEEVQYYSDAVRVGTFDAAFDARRFSNGSAVYWDGNTDGHVSAAHNLPLETGFYHVSYATPTMDDFKNGGGMVLNEWGYCYTFSGSDIVDVGNGILQHKDLYFIVIPEDNMVYDGIIEGMGMQVQARFPKKGTYFLKDSDSRLYLLEISGYKGFAEPIIRHEALPSHLQFGEVPVESDCLTWDGNLDGRYCALVYVHVSDTVPTLNELAAGGTIIAMTPEGVNEYMFDESNIRSSESGSLYNTEHLIYIDVADVGIWIATQDNAYMQDSDIDDRTCLSKAGIYFPGYEGTYVSRFTINGFDKFMTTETRPIDEKYLPYSKSDVVQEVLASIPTASSLTVSMTPV